MRINVEYYGYFREEAKKTKDVIETDGIKVRELYDKLKKKYNFNFEIKDILISINDKYEKNLNYDLQNNDTMIFLPPMSGG